MQKEKLEKLFKEIIQNIENDELDILRVELQLKRIIKSGKNTKEIKSKKVQLFEQKILFSKSLGYNNIAEALSKLGKFEFEKLYNNHYLLKKDNKELVTNTK